MLVPDNLKSGVSKACKYEPERVEAAAERVLKYNACSFRSMKAILATGLDRQDNRENGRQMCLPLHQNIRGKEYYQ